MPTSSSSDTVVSGNYIGTNDAGDDLGNEAAGFDDRANRIAFNLRDGISLQRDSWAVMRANRIKENGQLGVDLDGNTLGENGPTDNTSYFNTGDGIIGDTGLTVQRNTVRNNIGFGVQVNSRSLVADNNITESGGSGILLTGAENRIQKNNVASNSDHGIEVTSSVNLIIRNSAKANTNGNYDIVTNNRVGVIVTPPLSGVISNNGPGAGLGTLDPWANFAY